MCSEKKGEKGVAGFIFVEPSDAEVVSEVSHLREAVVDEGDEMGFSRASGTDKKQMVFVFSEGAFAN